MSQKKKSGGVRRKPAESRESKRRSFTLKPRHDRAIAAVERRYKLGFRGEARAMRFILDLGMAQMSRGAPKYDSPEAQKALENMRGRS